MNIFLKNSLHGQAQVLRYGAAGRVPNDTNNFGMHGLETRQPESE